MPLASPDEAAAYPYTPIDRERIARQRQRLVVGGIDSVKARLLALTEATRADELMITTMAFDHAARRHSYEIAGGSVWHRASCLNARGLTACPPEAGCLKFVTACGECGALQICRALLLIYRISPYPLSPAVAACQCVR